MKRVLAYLLLFVVVFVATVYLRFPYTQVVRQALSRHPLPGGVAVQFASLSPSGLGLAGRDLVVRKGDRELLRAARFRVGGLLRSLGGALHLKTGLDIFGGELRLVLAAADGGRYDVALDGEGLGVGPLLALVSGGLAETSGEVDAHLTYTGVPARWMQGRGEGALRGGPGRLAGITLLGQSLPAIPYEKLSGHLVLDKGVARVEKWSLTGPGLAATLDGRIHLRPQLTGSILDLTCQVRLPPAVATQMADLLDLAAQYRQRDGSYKVRLRGTVAQPRLR